MWKKILILLGAFLLIVGLLVVGGVIRKSQARMALEAYLAGLRAQGEPLTWKDLGYPPPPETNTSFDAFLAAVNRLGWVRPDPGELDQMHFFGPGMAAIGWAESRPVLSSSSRPATNAPTWKQFIADMAAASNALAEIRTSLRDPPRSFPMNLTNPVAMTTSHPFVAKRKAAQWLAADSLAALREKDLERSRADLHALTQMVQLHREDLTLVSAMVRVAISGLGLSATWEALQNDHWDDNALTELQHDWQAIDLIGALERGIAGERVWVLQYFENPDLTTPATAGMRGGQGLAGLRDEALGRLSISYWRAHLEEDELLYLRLKQNRLEMLRRLKTNAPGVSLSKTTQAQDDLMRSELEGTFARYRHLLTSVAMPNYSRAVAHVLRAETQRRMTIIAIALQRHHLKTGGFPANLDELMPGILPQLPMDPMSGQPFGYRTNVDGGFTLYSVGDDGEDDGGDATPRNPSQTFDLWSGKDAVWPTPDTP